ncbi:hypothetical protein QBC38DRAFT_505710 [Podospora fimiseda]|uniref:Uncharacterized protein n=1 Tax=Podospora fimiseda TaxID=252190 RepID=A0AAN6YL88_9PEZI|nr:hypothetical protein QBC38DRAFT_505710 [Podospora fimiseda]
MRDPSRMRWDNPVIQAELRRRILTQYYGWYISILTDIQGALHEVNQFLPNDKAYRIDSRMLKNAMFKAKSSLFSDKDRLLQRIHNRNEELSNLLLREFIQSHGQGQRTISGLRKSLTCETLYPVTANVHGNPQVSSKGLGMQVLLGTLLWNS